MGVTGLWRLIEPSGKPVPLETLENKVLAVDISIWLHQALKGFHDSQGAPLPNAHLLGVYHRVCKLLYFKIKPIFVFDGGVPNLKKETISKRNQQKTKKLNEAERIQKQLLTTLLKHSAVKQVLSERAKSNLIKEANLNLEDKNNVENIYKLPPSNFDSTTSTDEEGTSETSDSSPSKQWDLHTIDEQSSHFKSLPVDIRHEILTELKETRKQSSWGRLHELPKQSGDFASYQMKRLLKRYSVQVSLEEVQKEMGGCSMSLTELETLLKDQGVVLSNDSVGSRIASDENTKYLLIKDVKKAMDIARKQQELNAKKTELENEEGKEPEVATVEEEKDEVGSLEYEKDLELAIQLSLQDVPSTSKSTLSSIQEHSFLEYVNASQNSSESEEEVYDFSTARNYMMEYSGLTSHEINKIIDNNAAKPSKSSNIQNLKRKLIYKENLVENKSTGDPIKRNHTPSDVIPMDALQKNPKKQVEMSSLEDSEELEEKSLKNKSKEIIEVGDQIKSDDAVSSLAQVELEKSKIEAVEIMSSSEDSDEFMEVCEGSSKSSGSSKLEILIKPEDVLEDDLFGDIFTDQGVSRVSEKNVEKELATKDSIQSSDHCKNERLLKQPYEGVSNKQETTKHEVEAVENDKKTLNKEQNIVQKEVFNEEETDIDKEDINTIPKFVEPKQNSFLMVKESSAAIEKKKQVLTTDELEKIKSGLNQEKDELVSEMLTKNRMASNLTDQIHQEAQELLQLFGVPYIVAPMEAEAQCAFLEYIDFTNGTITDDSDIWLFGGKTVYKNFFDQRKLVMEYRSENISHNFKLNREQMILLALLVGSDYTTGLQGIGPVTALEILAAFPALKKLQSEPINDRYIVSGLQEFRKWLEENKSTGPSRIGLRNKLKNVSFIDSFPSLQVVKAYLEPAIDNSKEPFSWAKPDIPGLIEFARKKFGWSPMKSEKILEPVLKRLNEVRMQKSIKDYFSTKVIIDGKDAENKMSKRVKTAVKKIGQGDELEEDEPKKKKPTRKKAASTSKADPGLLTEFEKKDKPKVKKIQSRKRKVSSTTSDISKATAGLSSDEDVQELKNVCVQSTERMEKIQDEVKRDLEQIKKKPRTTASLHKKDVIPQKEKDKLYALRSKMKAIEVFRKSKKGPGYVKKRNTLLSKIKEDAELSESSSSD